MENQKLENIVTNFNGKIYESLGYLKDSELLRITVFGILDSHLKDFYLNVSKEGKVPNRYFSNLKYLIKDVETLKSYFKANSVGFKGISKIELAISEFKTSIKSEGLLESEKENEKNYWIPVNYKEYPKNDKSVKFYINSINWATPFTETDTIPVMTTTTREPAAGPLLDDEGESIL